MTHQIFIIVGGVWRLDVFVLNIGLIWLIGSRIYSRINCLSGRR